MLSIADCSLISFCLTSLVMMSMLDSTSGEMSFGIKKPYDVLPSRFLNVKWALVSSSIRDNIKKDL